MVGTFADVVVADAIVKGVSGFDLHLAKDALLKDVRIIYSIYCTYRRICTLFLHMFYWKFSYSSVSRIACYLVYHLITTVIYLVDSMYYGAFFFFFFFAVLH